MTAFLVALAAHAAAMSPDDETLLARLTPEVRQEVEARAVKGNTVRGAMHIMLYNRISKILETDQIRMGEVDYAKGLAFVLWPGDHRQRIRFDVSTLEIQR